MTKDNRINRREFIKRGTAGSAVIGLTLGEAHRLEAEAVTEQNDSPNNRITVGFIGVGARAHQLIEDFKKVPGVEIVGICDAYKGRLERASERLKGRAKVYSDHRELLAAPGIDAVYIATPDHLHKSHVIAALEAGKDVYIEKPLTYTVDEGLEIITAAKKSGKILQVGSQGVSSAIQARAREIVASGKLGQITMLRAVSNRNSPGGAWVYPIPPDASPQTVDWEMFQGPAKKRPFSLERFFRWRCFSDYSGGMATDLFIHLMTTIHYIMNTGAPESVMALGQLYRFRDGRDTTDTINAVVQYPEGFVVNLSGTFNSSGRGGRGWQILGTDGTLEVSGDELTFTPESKYDDNGWIVDSWPRALEEAYYKDPKVIEKEMPNRQPTHVVPGQERWQEVGRDATVAHIENFINGVRTRKQPYEDATVGHRAAAVAHMINLSANQQKVVNWDRGRDNVKAE
ncbi:MAG TPA: Gfo/Idh/MocA family oxidoreductase [Blastocatellia bacterium]|nr:Gfo/Idh/MocA family oxidoreductase [Blastocatellia bacterium]